MLNWPQSPKKDLKVGSSAPSYKSQLYVHRERPIWSITDKQNRIDEYQMAHGLTWFICLGAPILLAKLHLVDHHIPNAFVFPTSVEVFQGIPWSVRWCCGNEVCFWKKLAKASG